MRYRSRTTSNDGALGSRWSAVDCDLSDLSDLSLRRVDRTERNEFSFFFFNASPLKLVLFCLVHVCCPHSLKEPWGRISPWWTWTTRGLCRRWSERRLSLVLRSWRWSRVALRRMQAPLYRWGQKRFLASDVSTYHISITIYRKSRYRWRSRSYRSSIFRHEMLRKSRIVRHLESGDRSWSRSSRSF